MAHSAVFYMAMFKSDPCLRHLSARMRALQEIRMIFETALSLTLIGIVGAIVRVVEWQRNVLRGPYIRRNRRNG